MSARSGPFFYDDLTVTHCGGKWWILEDRLRYWSAYLEKQITVPEGFVTNFTSIPVLWNYPDCCSVIHDYMYRFTKKWDQDEADNTYWEAMRVKDYNIYLRDTIWFFVNKFGYRSFGKHEGALDPR